MHSATHAKMPIFNCYLLQFKKSLYFLYVYMFILLVVALLLAVPIDLRKSLQTTNLYILLCKVSMSKVKLILSIYYLSIYQKI